MELVERIALRDILALSCSMKRIGGANPGLLADRYIFWFYPDRIVQVEIGGRFVRTIEYANVLQRISQSFLGLAEEPQLNQLPPRPLRRITRSVWPIGDGWSSRPAPMSHPRSPSGRKLFG